MESRIYNYGRLPRLTKKQKESRRKSDYALSKKVEDIRRKLSETDVKDMSIDEVAQTIATRLISVDELKVKRGRERYFKIGDIVAYDWLSYAGETLRKAFVGELVNVESNQYGVFFHIRKLRGYDYQGIKMKVKYNPDILYTVLIKELIK